jgi:hypothetical protein
MVHSSLRCLLLVTLVVLSAAVGLHDDSRSSQVRSLCSDHMASLATAAATAAADPEEAMVAPT